MNPPTFVCYLTRHKRKETDKHAVAGLKHEVEFVRGLKKQGFDPMINTDRQPTPDEVMRMENAIVYFWTEDVPEMNLSKGVMGIPCEDYTQKLLDEREINIVAIQHYTEFIQRKDRFQIAQYIIEKMTMKKPHETNTPRILRYKEQGYFNNIPVYKCDTQHGPLDILIDPGK